MPGSFPLGATSKHNHRPQAFFGNPFRQQKWLAVIAPLSVFPAGAACRQTPRPASPPALLHHHAPLHHPPCFTITPPTRPFAKHRSQFLLSRIG